ncbi:transmembrane channel-like protein [Oppia nitens]|uniref:transmembrane channel-like protein n=1 Tax=Oppia nitens TaxID=1686743 RepID=UPI0023DAD3B0|nr:transmembrane channel-like protein [Oppia nitens]
MSDKSESPKESPKKETDSTSQSQTPTKTPYERQGRRQSLVPPDSEPIVLPRSRGSRSGGRRGSTAFLMGDDSIVMAFDGRRLSSFCTTSSNEETALSMGDDEYTEEQISETIRAHKQIITNMRSQHWPMHRKLKVLNRAKRYIKKHEGDLKQSKQAKDMVAKYRAYVERTINRLKREFANLIVVITPWEMRIKKIESHFGSGVASYFIFLRWVFWVNIFISVFICCFVMVPEILRGDPDLTGMRKEVKDKDDSLKLQAIWDFEGYLKFSPIFYGYYSKSEMTSEGYRLPLAYFLTQFCLYMFSFFCILRKMAQNARMSRVSSKEDECTFCWKLFTGWDYMIGNSETAYNKVASLVMGFKESILEEKERKKDERNWKRIALRVLANILVLMLLASSAYGVVLVVERSQEPIDNPSWLRANEVTLVVAGIGIVFPNIFDLVGNMEAYHPRITLRWQLGRILMLNFINMYTLMLSLFGKVNSMTAELTDMRVNITYTKFLVDTVAISTTAHIRFKRDGRVLAPDYDYSNEEMTSTLHSPSIIVDPYSYAAIKESLRSNRIEGRNGIEEYSTTTEAITSTQIDLDDYDRGFQDYESTTTFIIDINNSTSGNNTTIYTTTERTNTWMLTETTTPIPHRTSQRPRPTRKRPRLMTTPMTTTPITTESQWNGTLVSVNTSWSSETTISERPSLEWFRQNLDKPCDNKFNYNISEDDLVQINETDKERLRKLCWETMFGQELVKLTVMDTVLTVISILIGDFIRALIVRYCNDCTCICWDLEKKFPGYGDFKIAENILHLVNNQGMIWMGMFFSPGLPAINTIKLCIIMYIRSWAVITCNIPHETVFKASRSNNFYFGLLLLMLFLCTLPVGYAVVWLEPSWHCGPFSGYSRIFHILTKYIESKLPDTINKVVDYLTSPGAVFPLLLLMILFIYYLISMVGSLKDANKDLKSQIRKDKDVSEVGAIPEIVAEPPPEKKHVRIQETATTDVTVGGGESSSTNDKTKLIQSRVNSADDGK